MRTVRNTVDTRRTVVCTIHQPSIDIFEAFDELFLLKRGGKEIYVGPVGRQSCELIKYFEDIDGISKITDGYNPATWMLEVTSPAQEMALGIDFTETYRNSDLYKRNKALIAELSVPAPGLSLGSMFWDLGSKVSSRIDLFNAMGSMDAACLFLGIDSTVMLKSGEIFVNPWSTSTITNLTQKMKAKLSKYKGYYSIAKAYPGKVALSTLAKSVRNKVIIDIGGKKYQIIWCAG
ncbi:hypothetical protein POM88_007605 [Heracleum sosnowskyi]|uniref:ABC transporter family G domain-containing protein n=1 Tax=Heracleum sosnowskyi TaxID=360622 RepID=A0AAD8N6D3_9APIA|nr:hypothetical protein POM88_007605 [Heracleum sosnowskyi]